MERGGIGLLFYFVPWLTKFVCLRAYTHIHMHICVCFLDRGRCNIVQENVNLNTTECFKGFSN